jgi:hypothetical protein
MFEPGQPSLSHGQLCFMTAHSSTYKAPTYKETSLASQ